MILAAGLGTRLGELTERTPKALIHVGGVPMLERVARKLVAAGVERLIVNVHHHAEQIEEFISSRGGFGVEVRISREDEQPLETGGGLLAAESLFSRDRPFFLYNVDIVSDLDLVRLYEAHSAGDSIATLAGSYRETTRPLLVERGEFRGLANRRTGWRTLAREPETPVAELGFAGVHVVSPQIFPLITERGRFGIMELYLRLVREGSTIGVYDIGDALWLEVGDPERLERARRLLATRQRS